MRCRYSLFGQCANRNAVPWPCLIHRSMIWKSGFIFDVFFVLHFVDLALTLIRIRSRVLFGD